MKLSLWHADAPGSLTLAPSDTSTALSLTRSAFSSETSRVSFQRSRLLLQASRIGFHNDQIRRFGDVRPVGDDCFFAGETTGIV